ncbi:hypothetical protein [Cupriavidus sp. UGS-1]|uniref:hypothetical protein n=1 Tax=Cupriavidus sp. UGS-1 TaxID=2899826 RepID=UPI001E5A754F|nr:hypothetical protein [Cupriavidus sp. UGS-1]MCD9122734.1 hypothetical protein [Cupriavidus sp. UGS-1]
MALRNGPGAAPHVQIIDVLHAAGAKVRLYRFAGPGMAHVVHQRPRIALEQLGARLGAGPAAKMIAIGVKTRGQRGDRRVRQRALDLCRAHQHYGDGSGSEQKDREFHRIGIGAGSRRPCIYAARSGQYKYNNKGLADMKSF